MANPLTFPSAETCLEGPLPGGWLPQPTLAGHGLRLRPLLLTDHDALAAWACDPLLWAQHPMPERGTPEGFRQFCTQLFVQGGALVAEDGQGRLVACSSYYGWDEDASEVLVGYTFIDRACWGSVVNLALKRLMFDHVFEGFGCVKLTVGEHNWRSRHAVLALGAEEVGEQWREHQGKTLRSVVYAMSRQAWQDGLRDRLLQRLQARQARQDAIDPQAAPAP